MLLKITHCMCRWLDTSGVSIACEERDATDCKRHHWRKPEGRNCSIFTFRIASGREKLHGAPLV